MSKIIATFLLTIIASCGGNNGNYNAFYKKAHARQAGYINASSSTEEEETFSYNSRPSDSFATTHNPRKFNYLRTANNLPQKYDNVNSDLKDIMQNGEYIGKYKVGNPYKIEDVYYYPQEYDDYEETGVSSWYGDDFHGKLTSNGEIYNSGSMTAAHQTLPLPSIVRVTNLENGRNVLVRVNDRGPFSKNRIIDVSEKAAELLGYKEKGTSIVKVEFLPRETEELLKTLNLK